VNNADSQLVKNQLEEISQLLANSNLSYEERQRLELLQAQLSGELMTPWLPYGVVRKLLMLIFVFLGVVGVLAGNVYTALLLIFAILFSPRVVGELAYRLGKFSG